MKQHYQVLDSFRGICACIVAFSHFNANSIIYGSSLLDRGAPYVDFFFVLSGFVIFANYSDRMTSGYSIKNFILLRFGRLYPLHFFVLMGFVSIEVLQLFLHVDQAALYAPFSSPGEGLGDIIAILFLVHSLNVSENLAFNGPSWSISVEFYTYILFAFIMAYAGRYYKIIIVVMAIVSAVLLYFLYGELYAKLNYGFLRCVYGFSCGALTWIIYQNIYKKTLPLFKDRIRAHIIEILLLSTVIIYILYFSFNTLSFIAPVLFSLVVFVFAFEGGAISKLLKAKFFLFLGMLSYSIYMVHLFISGKFFALPIRLLENRMNFKITVDVDGTLLYGTNLLYGTLLEVFYLFIVILCSFISYKIIEEPFRDWSKRIVRRRQAKVVEKDDSSMGS